MSNELPNPPMPANPTEQTKSSKNKKLLIIVALVFLCLIIIVLVVLYILLSNSASNNNLGNNPSSSANDTQTNTDQNPQQQTNQPEAVDNKIYYVQGNNIYSYDVDSHTSTELTNYPANPQNTPAYDSNGTELPSIDIRSLQVIDGDNVGFTKCATVTGNFGCGVFTINVNSGSVTSKKTLGNSDYLLVSGFSSTTKFAYLYTTDTKWVLKSNDNGSESTLENINIEAYGRGGFVEDSEKIRFSPDGTKMFEISTSSPRDPMDFNVYIYNLATNTTQTIEHATQPEWLNDSVIVYRQYNNSSTTTNGIYSYNVDDASSTQITGISSTSYNPSVLTGSNMIIYSDNSNHKVYVYDLDTNTNTQVATNAKDGFWISDTKLAFTELQACVNEEDCPMEGVGSLIDKSFDTYNLDTSSKTVTPLNITSVGGASWMTSKYGN